MSYRDDTHKRPADVSFVQIGTGQLITRSCGKCGKRQAQQTGSRRHKIFGWIGPCCAKGKA